MRVSLWSNLAVCGRLFEVVRFGGGETMMPNQLSPPSGTIVVKPWLTGVETISLINHKFETMTRWQFYGRARHYFRSRKDKGARVKYKAKSIFEHYGAEVPPEAMIAEPQVKDREEGAAAAI
jgi:hypothetical protein